MIVLLLPSCINCLAVLRNTAAVKGKQLHVVGSVMQGGLAFGPKW
jgi:hypothetical protein